MILRHSHKVLALLLLGGALLPGVALADATSDFQARYAQLKAAMDTREPDKIKPLLTPDFSATDIAGRKQTADDMIDRLSMIVVDPDRQTKTTVEAVDVQGNTALVTQRLEASGTREGRDGKAHTMSFATVSHDTWVQSGSTWLLKATETEDMTITRDGEVLRHMKQGDPMPEGGMRHGGHGAGGGGMGPPPGGPPAGGDGPMGPPPPGDDGD